MTLFYSPFCYFLLTHASCDDTLTCYGLQRSISHYITPLPARTLLRRQSFLFSIYLRPTRMRLVNRTTLPARVRVLVVFVCELFGRCFDVSFSCFFCSSFPTIVWTGFTPSVEIHISVCPFLIGNSSRTF